MDFINSKIKSRGIELIIRDFYKIASSKETTKSKRNDMIDKYREIRKISLEENYLNEETIRKYDRKFKDLEEKRKRGKEKSKENRYFFSPY